MRLLVGLLALCALTSCADADAATDAVTATGAPVVPPTTVSPSVIPATAPAAPETEPTTTTVDPAAPTSAPLPQLPACDPAIIPVMRRISMTVSIRVVETGLLGTTDQGGAVSDPRLDVGDGCIAIDDDPPRVEHVTTRFQPTRWTVDAKNGSLGVEDVGIDLDHLGGRMDSEFWGCIVSPDDEYRYVHTSEVVAVLVAEGTSTLDCRLGGLNAG